ncbi:MAG: hypothetical protein Ta2A_02260 [Treponemataceae bacterium]|nr:MAG: hypothetical protein Ta2A_02260 [Treponemataceae bacterium]
MTVELEKTDMCYLETLAGEHGTSAENYAKEALENWLENQALLKLATQRKKEWIADGCKTVSWAQVKAENGL